MKTPNREDHDTIPSPVPASSLAMFKKIQPSCSSVRAFALIAIIVIIVNIHLRWNPNETVLQERSVSESDDKPDEPLQPDPVSALPKSEQNLYQKAVKTNYSTIWMGPSEVNMLLRYIDGKETYLEWGSGGSTMNFPRFVSRAVSIEHDSIWCGDMKAKIAADGGLDHVDYHCVPVKRGTAGWGKKSAFEEGNYIAFRDYVNEIDNVGGLFDFVLIDGRARVDCAIKALSYIKNSSVVVLHDASRMWGSGPYSGVKRWYSFLNYIGGDGKQGIAILRRKSEMAKYEGDHDAVRQLLNERHPQAPRTSK